MTTIRSVTLDNVSVNVRMSHAHFVDGAPDTEEMIYVSARLEYPDGGATIEHNWNWDSLNKWIASFSEQTMTMTLEQFADEIYCRMLRAAQEQNGIEQIQSAYVKITRPDLLDGRGTIIVEKKSDAPFSLVPETVLAQCGSSFCGKLAQG